jgi:hypothetical protein
MIKSYDLSELKFLVVKGVLCLLTSQRARNPPNMVCLEHFVSLKGSVTMTVLLLPPLCAGS